MSIFQHDILFSSKITHLLYISFSFTKVLPTAVVLNLDFEDLICVIGIECNRNKDREQVIYSEQLKRTLSF